VVADRAGERRTEVGKIVVSENVSLDGVIEDPAGEEGFRLGGWVGQIKDREAVGKAVLDEALGAEALLFGRRSYEFFAARWPSRSGELADRLNSLPKYVVSSTLEDADWNNSTVLTGDVAKEVSKLKQELDGEIAQRPAVGRAHAGRGRRDLRACSRNRGRRTWTCGSCATPSGRLATN
jgi:dihydrofolate reductase